MYCDSIEQLTSATVNLQDTGKIGVQTKTIKQVLRLFAIPNFKIATNFVLFVYSASGLAREKHKIV